jgi:integrase
VLLTDAVSVYVSDRRLRGEIGVRTAGQLAWRLGTLCACHPGLDVVELDRDRVLEWQRTTGWQRPASRRAYLSTLKVFCVWAADAGLLQHDPTVRLARIREPRPSPRNLSESEMARLTLVLPDDRARLIVGLMRHGLRCCEVSRLTAADYDPGGRIWVWGKNDQHRRVPVLPWLSVLLDRQVSVRPSGPMVGLSAERISRLVSGWMDRAGVKVAPKDGRSAHAIRHTAAGRVLAGCGNVHTVKDFLGHQSLATTTRYLPDTPEETMRAGMTAGRL